VHTLSSILTVLVVGMISISAVENARLSESTARDQNAPDRFIAEPEVFHQLHCLVGTHALIEIFMLTMVPQRIIREELWVQAINLTSDTISNWEDHVGKNGSRSSLFASI
jgi:hypothetical protein